MNGSNGFRLEGGAVTDELGDSVASAGDVNGDGYADLIIGSLLGAPNGNAGAGSSYVIFGRSSGFTSAINISSLDGSIGFRLNGVSPLDNSGRSVASAGDVDGDGFADLIIGASQADPNGTVSGASYVYFSPATGGATYHRLPIERKAEA